MKQRRYRNKLVIHEEQPKPELKYHNQKVEIDGICFDSKREARRYVYLKHLQEGGLISDLTLQPEFELIPKHKHDGQTVRATKYRADFQYVQDGKIVIEDVKGFANAEFKLKKKLFEYLNPDLTITLI